MADKSSGCPTENVKDKSVKRTNLTLQEVLDAVLDTEDDISDNDSIGESSFDEMSGSESGEGEVPIQYVTEDACYIDSWLHLDVSCY